MATNTETELVLKAKQDCTAFILLYRAYLPRVYQYVFFRVKNREEAEDITSTVWEKVLTHLPTFNPAHEHSFPAWLFRIAHNQLTDFYRKNSNNRAPLPLESQTETADPQPHPLETIMNRNRAQSIKKLVDRLPPQQAQTIELRFFAELKNHEIARLQGISEKTVASNLCRGLRTLQQLWTASGDAVKRS
ncbi:MAG TPA: sigma-70 family RNA polymerase sigma factor [bacterium]|nr:sigma-70 family RNA polymerase sigma factor [bacterium]